MSGWLFPLAVLVTAIVLAAVVVVARLIDARAWRMSLVGVSLRLPTGLSPDDVASWLASLAALTHAPRGVLLPTPPVVLEVRATAIGIEHRLFVPRQMTGALLSSLRAALPGVRLEELELDQPPQRRSGPASPVALPVRVAAEVRLAGRLRQLAVERAENTNRSLLAALQPLQGAELLSWQWIITGAVTPAPVQVSSSEPLPWWLEANAPTDADELRAARLKQREPLLQVTGRLVVTAASRPRALSLFGRAWGPIRLLNVPGARLVRAWWPSSLVVRRAATRQLPVLRWPLRLNTKELAGLLALPLGEALLPGVRTGASRQVPASAGLPTTGTVLADSTYPGAERPLALARADRTMHVWVGGPTGVGKSTLLASMIGSDASYGDGLAVIDPKGDLVTDVLARIPERRRADVIVLDPSDTAAPIGFNVLSVNGNEADRELAVDHVLHVLREQWRAYWGPRTESVLRSALLTLTHARAADGSAFTLCEVPELLSNKTFRRWVTAQSGLPESVRTFWLWFEGLSEAERVQVIGPVLNKLSAFTQRTPLRLMLGQSGGLDLARAMRERKLLLVPLSRGRLGAETASLVGSLLVAALWQTALGRTGIAAGQRRPWWLYIDEAQEVVRLPLEIADMLAEARGLQVGITLANQHLSQLPESVRRALLSTVRSHIVFQLEPDDARVLARSFSPTLEEADLRTLPAYEVAMRLCVGGQTTRPVTGKTRPLPAPSSDPGALRTASREQHGMSRAEVEAGLRSRIQVPGSQPTKGRGFGQRPIGPGADQ